jgi:hypothetical protein
MKAECIVEVSPREENSKCKARHQGTTHEKMHVLEEKDVAILTGKFSRTMSPGKVTPGVTFSDTRRRRRIANRRPLWLSSAFVARRNFHRKEKRE